MRTTIVAASTAPQTRAMRPVLRSESATSSRIGRIWSPISRKTTFSSMNCTVRQLVLSARRDAADCSTGALWPSSRPVTTTASTPDASMASAGRKAT